MVHLGYLGYIVVAGLLALGCSKTEKEIPKNSQPKLPPEKLPPDPNQMDKSGAPMPKPSAADSEVNPPPQLHEKNFLGMGDFHTLTEPQKQFQRTFHHCYYGNVAAKDAYKNRDGEYTQCLKQTLQKNPGALSREFMEKRFASLAAGTWENLRRFEHYNTNVMFDRMMIYGEALGKNKTKLTELEDRFKKAQEENLRLQKRYCFSSGYDTSKFPPPPEDLVCPPFKVNTLDLVKIEGRVPKDSKAPGTDLTEPYKGGPNIPGTDLTRPKKSRKPPKPGSLEDRITNPYQ